MKTAFYFNITIKMLKFTAAEPKWEEPSARTQHPWPVETQSGLSLTVLGPREPSPAHLPTAPAQQHPQPHSLPLLSIWYVKSTACRV